MINVPQKLFLPSRALYFSVNSALILIRSRGVASPPVIKTANDVFALHCFNDAFFSSFFFISVLDNNILFDRKKLISTDKLQQFELHYPVIAELNFPREFRTSKEAFL